MVMAAGVAWLLLLVVWILRLRGARGPRGAPFGTAALSPVEVALLRGGKRAAARTGLVELYLGGAVEPAWQQTVHRCGSPRGGSDVARAQFRALQGHMHPRQLQRLDGVRSAVHDTSEKLARAGLLVSRRRARAVRFLLLPVFGAAPVGAIAGGQAAPWLSLALLADAGAVALWVWPRRTLCGTNLLDRLRRDHAATRWATEREPEALLLGVALFGVPVLRDRLPRFTEQSGLLTRPPRTPTDRGGGGSGDPFAPCGG
ncbi:TIGR04222 domain-containing membrane protein [Streptomyces sp. RerS4]|uniref:TIGR04222 domain-containing membrane protein n=1 Tax=Streptomyces sp. RerS4 TaxID=2942449 RepID=UPI00201C8E3C|nr:TIGR04222 domain-containing membrane protein [Streptomyces sp. RerS4]UQW99474.1 TIGR04222 domain-containing membrane protein [Streptomyces sp. RerS4]